MWVPGAWTVSGMFPVLGGCFGGGVSDLNAMTKRVAGVEQCFGFLAVAFNVLISASDLLAVALF